MDKTQNLLYFIHRDLDIIKDMVAEAISAVKDVVAAPAISCSDNTVTMTCATTGADIYYTNDGTEPSAESTKYTSAISLGSTKTFKAVAIKDAWTSNITTQVCEYTS